MDCSKFLGNGALTDPHWLARAATQARMAGLEEGEEPGGQQASFRGLLRDLGSNYGKCFSNHRGEVKREEEDGGWERLANYGTDAQQHLGVNTLRMGAVISLTPSHLFPDS